jgi:hypothetical protein
VGGAVVGGVGVVAGAVVGGVGVVDEGLATKDTDLN